MPSTMNKSLTNQITAGIGLALALLIANTVVSYRNTQKIVENERWVSHTHQVLTELESTLSTLKDAETGQRGYLLTGEERYLEPYKSALAHVNERLTSLQQLTADNDAQQQKLGSLRIAIDSKLAELQETIELRRQQNLEAALQVVKSGRGKQIMGGIRQQVAAMTAIENRLLQARSRESQASVNAAMLTFTVATLANLLLMALVYYLVKRDRTLRDREETKQNQLLGRLEHDRQSLQLTEERFRRAILDTPLPMMQRAFRNETFANTSLQIVRDGDAAVFYLNGDAEYSDRARYQLPSIILLDLKLPRRSGHEVLAWLRQQPQLKHLPVVILTSSRQTFDVDRAYDLGVNSYLVKPVGFGSLLEMINTFSKYWLNYTELPELI